MTQQNNETKEVSVQLLNKVLEYLGKRPASEVYSLINDILALASEPSSLPVSDEAPLEEPQQVAEQAS